MTSEASSNATTADWLVGGGATGQIIRLRDWSATALGPLESWPQSLRSAVSILLPSKAQICLFWGHDLVALYNDAYRPTLGVKHPRALGLPAREVWSEIWEDVLAPLLQGVRDTGEAFWASDHPFVLERRGYPEETYFDISYDPVRDESGRVGGVFCIVSETTRRVVGERRLRTLRDLARVAADARSVADAFQRARAVLESNPHDIACASLHGADFRPLATCRMQPCAGAAELLREAGDAIGRTLRGDDLAPLGALSGGAWPEPARAAVILPITVQGRDRCGTLVVGASPRLELDDAYHDFLRLIASNIAAAVAAARTLEEQRARAEALAELDRAKTAFFGNVSHEFRTPLTLMLGPLEDLLDDDELGAAQRARIDAAHRNSLRLLKLVNTVLDFSRLEAGRARASYFPVDLAKLTAEIASNFSSVCERGGLRLRIACAPLRGPVFVDRDMWEKVVLNLLSNAFKFTFAGGIDVELAESAGRARLLVRDTGTGIAPEELPRLFERFHRIEGAQGRTHEGSGIGLALVHELVRLHGGEIGVESELGRGSTFTVSLPFGSSHLPKEQVADERAAPPAARDATAFVQEALASLRKDADDPRAGDGARDAPAKLGKVLVVDDNVDMRDHVVRLLEPLCELRTAPDGIAALAAIRAEDFDLVITDVMMPRLDGFGLLQAIKTDPVTARMPVLMLSARAGEEARLDGVAAGADDYVIKPFTGPQLIAQVKAQLTIGRTRRESERERERLLALERDAKLEAKLQREHLFALFMQAPNPIVILRGPTHTIELANEHACRVWGREHDDVIGRPLFEALPQLRDHHMAELLDEVLRTGVPHVGKEVPAPLQRTSGGARESAYFNFVYAPLRGVGGSVDGVLGTAFDVTDEVRARDQLEFLRRESDAANRAKDEFLAMLGHELRNPLSPIVTALHLMRMRGTQSVEFEILERQVGHLTRLVDDLLDVSRITRGKVALQRQPIELALAVTRALETAGPIVEQGRHEVDVRVAPQGLAVDGDLQRLAQVFANLVTNAAKYSQGGSRIVLVGERVGDRVRLTISDQGVGIAPEMIERVFDLFVQQPQTIARSAGGLGLGLAIVRNLVELHGGKVWVRSAGTGQGSEFTVELPASEHAAIAPERAPEIGRARIPSVARRILIVDDNVDAATTLGEALRDAGHEVVLAADGPAALLECERFDPAIALIDIGLPMMDGYEVARRLRERRRESSPILLIAITGYGLTSDRSRSLDAGFSDHLVKPVDVGRLQRLLAETPT